MGTPLLAYLVAASHEIESEWRECWTMRMRQKTAMGTVGRGVWSQRDRRSPWAEMISSLTSLSAAEGWNVFWHGSWSRSIHIKRLG